ncbi:hypothetical protein MHF_0391 [Mycoplasma haemofelis Ohio2]|uniref:Uncharacterized protein n=1 Tax=Mycoplasma haemofelis (strain Ohio2) TaxID=859194 RepID=F6FH62_MYCHI|nr:hypothetical protein MHF_0391 [Mycoplasma haemofelis Ohio2]
MNAKLLGAVGSLGAAATSGGMYLAFSGDKEATTSVSELFQKEKGWKLMTASDDSKWNEAWGRYKNDHKSNGTYLDKDKWRLPNWKNKRDGSEAFLEFKQECEKRTKVAVKDTESQEYQNVKKYCARPKKVSELLTEATSKTLLDKNGDAEAWNASWDKYKQEHLVSSSGNTVAYKNPDKWGITGWGAVDTLGVLQGYKDKCEEKWNSHIDPEKLTEDETFKEVLSSCTK